MRTTAMNGAEFDRDVPPRAGQTMAEVVTDRSNAGLLAVIERLLDSAELLDEAAGRSYRHQLGFLKLVLKSESDGSCLRLHVWDQPLFALEDPHTHCADFCSRIVEGSLVENAFVLESGGRFSKFRYRFDPVARHSMALSVGTTDVVIAAHRLLTRGDIYRKHAGDLHSVSEAAVGTITVSAWGPRHSDALVLKPFGADAEACFAMAGMPMEEFAALLRNIVERLDR